MRDGSDPITKPALDYITGLGVPASLIKRIEIDSPANDVQTIKVTLMVDPCAAGCPDPERHAEGGHDV